MNTKDKVEKYKAKLRQQDSIKPDCFTVEYDRAGRHYEQGLIDGEAEADKWWAERWKGLRDGKYSLMRAPHVNDELDAKAKEVLGER